MNKIVVERERKGSWKPNRKWGKQLTYVAGCDYEDEPKRVSSSRHRQYHYSKWFSDVLNPVEGFLRKNIGRPWDKVYSELRRGLDVRKVTGLHIFQHLEAMVELNCFEDDNGAIQSSWSHYRHAIVEGFYVHPRTRLLQYASRTSRAEWQRKEMQNREIRGFWIDENQAYRLYDGIWYIVTYKNFQQPRVKSPVTLSKAWDVVKRTYVQLSAGNNFVAVRKKQCNREEIAEVQKLITEWEGSLRQRAFKINHELRVIFGNNYFNRW